MENFGAALHEHYLIFVGKEKVEMAVTEEDAMRIAMAISGFNPTKLIKVYRPFSWGIYTKFRAGEELV
jgi:hypothetical protein